MTIFRAEGVADTGAGQGGVACGGALIDVVSFASCYVYSPSGSCEASAHSRRLCALLKAGNRNFLGKCAARVSREARERPLLADFLDVRCVMMPVPGSAPRSPGASWVAADLAAALLRAGLGAGVWTGLRRVSPVRKSGTAPAGARPTVAQHYRTLAMDHRADVPADILLVDDVVTKGRTLLAAASRVHEAFPRVRIRAFALVRTMGFLPDVGRLLDPCVGAIRRRGGEAYRYP